MAIDIAQIFRDIKPVFIRWERLRILYNLMLILLVLYPYDLATLRLRLPEFLVLLMGAVLANLCFLAGPIAESYLYWIGIRSRAVTAGLFILGTLV